MYSTLIGILMECSTYSSVQYSRFSLALRPSRSVRAPMDPRVAFSYRKNRITVLSSKTSDIALFAYLEMRTYHLIFSIETVFFSHNKSANSTFSHNFLVKRTEED
jgi:hypothetical protein